MTDSNKGIGEMIKLGLILVCYAVAACTVVIKPLTIPNLSLRTLEIGAKQLVVHEALEIIV